MVRLSSQFLFLAPYSIAITLVYFTTDYFNIAPNSYSPNFKKTNGRQQYEFDRWSKILFIGGYERSGTTIFQMTIEAHPHIKCSAEISMTRIILDMVEKQWTREQKTLYSNSVAQFLLTVIAERFIASPILCYKEPRLAPHIEYLNQLFPAPKFLVLVRDGRAVAHSNWKAYYFKRYGDVPELSDYEYALYQWNQQMKNVLKQCLHLAADLCMVVFYELFVSSTESVLKEIANYVGVEYLNWTQRKRTAWMSVSPRPYQASMFTNITNDINNGSFYIWMVHDDQVSRQRAAQLAPMLNVLGYDTTNKVPDYTIERMIKANKKIIKMRNKYR